MATTSKSGFYIAPFGMEGEQVGIAFWNRSQLSRDWLRICSDFLTQHGSAFDAPWSGSLAHIRTKFTAASGAALVTFVVNGKAAASHLLLSGGFPSAEQVVADMFTDSLCRTIEMHSLTSTSPPFSAISALIERPLMVVVTWPDTMISDEDHALVRELGLHLAGAFLFGTEVFPAID